MKKVILLSLYALIVQFATAQNANIKRIGQSTFSVGAYDHPFRYERVVANAGTPPTLNADWAACIMMVLNYNGLNVQQDQILSLNNNRVSEALNAPQDLMFAVNRTSPHDWGDDSKIYTATATLDADVIFDELSAGRPLILGTGAVGMEGRAFVLTAMTYTIKFDANGQQTGIIPQTVTIRDPWPQALASRVVNWQDFVPLTASLYTVKVVFKK